MGDSLFGSLHSIAPRETAGAITGARYRFQTNLAIVELCELLEGSENDFALLVEHLDDITIIEFEPDPRFTFLQAKAKSTGSWTVQSLTKSAKEGSPPTSIIGKLYSSAAVAGDETKSLVFMSNAPYSIKLANGKKCSSDATEVIANSVHADERKKIEDALELDFPSPREPDCIKLLKFRKTDLSHTDPDAYVIGRIAKVLEARGAHDGAVTAIYKTLFHELTEKASNTDEHASTDGLINSKGVKRKEFESVLDRSRSKKRFQNSRPLIDSDLKDAGYNSLQRARVFSACNSFIANRARGEFGESLLSDKLVDYLEENEGVSETCGSILEIAELALAKVQDELDFASDTIFAAALVVISEFLDV